MHISSFHPSPRLSFRSSESNLKIFNERNLKTCGLHCLHELKEGFLFFFYLYLWNARFKKVVIRKGKKTYTEPNYLSCVLLLVLFLKKLVYKTVKKSILDANSMFFLTRVHTLFYFFKRKTHFTILNNSACPINLKKSYSNYLNWSSLPITTDAQWETKRQITFQRKLDEYK